MGEPPTAKHQLDRRNNNGNYERDNCHWVTSKEQQNNKRSNHFLTHNGQTMTVTQWAELLGVKRNMLYKRLIADWTVEKTLTKPPSAKSDLRGQHSMC